MASIPSLFPTSEAVHFSNKSSGSGTWSRASKTTSVPTTINKVDFSIFTAQAYPNQIFSACPTTCCERFPDNQTQMFSNTFGTVPMTLQLLLVPASLGPCDPLHWENIDTPKQLFVTEFFDTSLIRVLTFGAMVQLLPVAQLASVSWCRLVSLHAVQLRCISVVVTLRPVWHRCVSVLTSGVLWLQD